MTGDSTDNIPGIEGVGEKGALKILNNLSEEEDPLHSIMQRYITKYGAINGIAKFSEALRLVYMFTCDEDFIREIGYVPEIPEPFVIEQLDETPLNPFEHGNR